MDTLAFAGRFLPKGTDLFLVDRAGDKGRPQLFTTQKKPIWKKDVIVLVDEDTGPAGRSTCRLFAPASRLPARGNGDSGPVRRI